MSVHTFLGQASSEELPIHVAIPFVCYNMKTRESEDDTQLAKFELPTRTLDITAGAYFPIFNTKLLFIYVDTWVKLAGSHFHVFSKCACG